MDGFQLNKIAMGVLGSAFFVMAVAMISDSIFHAEPPKAPGYAIEAETASASAGAGADAGPAYEPIESLLASADPAAGAKAFKKCAACHASEEGGAKKVGPNLWSIIGKPIATEPDFAYSSALRAYGEGKVWTYEELNGFLWNPRKFIKGTAMGFAGLKKTKDRADLIAWLRAASNDPAPLP